MGGERREFARIDIDRTLRAVQRERDAHDADLLTGMLRVGNSERSEGGTPVARLELADSFDQSTLSAGLSAAECSADCANTTHDIGCENVEPDDAGFHHFSWHRRSIFTRLAPSVSSGRGIHVRFPFLLQRHTDSYRHGHRRPKGVFQFLLARHRKVGGHHRSLM